MGATREFAPLSFLRKLVANGMSIQLITERDRLNKDLELAHSTIKALEAELDNLQVGYGRGSGRR